MNTQMISITLKRMDGVSKKISVDSDKSFTDIKEDIFTHAMCENLENIKIIFAGKVLDWQSSLSQQQINDGSQLIILVNKKKSVKINQVIQQTDTSEQEDIAQQQTTSQQEDIAQQEASAKQEASAQQTDTTYSLNQIHAIIPVLMSWISASSELRDFLTSDITSLNEFLSSQTFLRVLEPLMSQSSQILDNLRTEQPFNVVIGANSRLSESDNNIILPSMRNLIRPQREPSSASYQPIGPQIIRLNQSINSAIPVLSNNAMYDNMIYYMNRLIVPNLASAVAPINSQQEEESDGENSEQNQSDIIQITTITGCSEDVARTVYESNNNNVITSINTIIDMMS
jgi:hypothetical protein